MIFNRCCTFFWTKILEIIENNLQLNYYGTSCYEKTNIANTKINQCILTTTSKREKFSSNKSKAFRYSLNEILRLEKL